MFGLVTVQRSREKATAGTATFHRLCIEDLILMCAAALNHIPRGGTAASRHGSSVVYAGMDWMVPRWYGVVYKT